MTLPGKKINVVVESELDLAVVSKLVEYTGCEIKTPYIRKKKQIKEEIGGYNKAADSSFWFVLIDLDEKPSCAPSLVREWLEEKSPNLCFRVAVREVEGWLISDRERFSHYLSIPLDRIHSSPDTIECPKEYLIRLAEHSTDRKVQKDIIPTRESGKTQGRGYNARLTGYVQDTERGWRLEVAAQKSPSLAKAIACLEKLCES